MASESASPPRRQVVEFKYEYPIYEPYLKPFDFESDPDFDLSYFVDSDTDEEVEEHEIADSRETLLKHVKQVRESFGFDVDCAAPRWFPGHFFPIDVSKPHAHTMERAQHAIDEINAEMSGKMYELVKVDRLVMASGCSILHLTLTAKEVEVGVVDKLVTLQALVSSGVNHYCKLLQWRFKPLALL